MNQHSASPYDFLSRAFHWVTAIVVTIAFVLGPGGFGRLMREGIDPATRSDIVWHESLGLLVFVLTVLRLIWVAFRPAAPQVQMASWMQLTGKLVHVALWMLLLALPATALLALGNKAHPLTLLGGVRMDPLPVIANPQSQSWPIGAKCTNSWGMRSCGLPVCTPLLPFTITSFLKMVFFLPCCQTF